MVISCPSMSAPELSVVRSKAGGNGTSDAAQKFDFEKPGRGFYFEADAVALDIAAGRSQNNLMPWEETLRIMELLDEIRRQGGARFPQDEHW